MKSYVINTSRYTLAAFALVLAGCSRQISEPISPPNNHNGPGAPSSISANVGDRAVQLSWTMADPSSAAKYRIYMSNADTMGFRIQAESTERQYTVTGLQNAVEYYFRVTGVNSAGYEGQPSDIIMAIPNLYSVTINNGDNYTNSWFVTLTLIAPTTTQFMQISSDSSFVGAQWENYAGSRSWQFAAGDGMKSVYAKFRDSTDRISIGLAADSILLDTQAEIDSVTFSPVGVPFAPGDRIHFREYTGEPNGRASIVVGQGIFQANLYDDGTRGDVVAGDGIYEVDYLVSNTLDFENGDVFGNFVDRAGNTAQRVQAAHNISVRQPPDPVSIVSVVAPGQYFDRLILTWTASNAADFGQYQVFRSSNPGVDSTDVPVDAITSRNQTTLTDSGLVQNIRYYYKVYVLDNTNLWTGSNEASGLTNRNLPPDPLVLFPILPVPGSRNKLQISWSASNDIDFLRYELYRSIDSNVDTTDAIVFISNSQVSCIDSNLGLDSTYYYRVLARDRAGNWSWSNVQSGRTLPAILGLSPDKSGQDQTSMPAVQSRSLLAAQGIREPSTSEKRNSAKQPVQGHP